MSGTKRDTLLGATAIVALLGASAPALARDQATSQTPAATSTAPAEDTTSQQSRAAGSTPILEEVVVTGTRNNQFGTDVVQAGSFRGAKALDVPLTISVIPSAVLQSQQAITLMDALRNTAGVSSTGVGPVAYDNVTIRGIPVDTRNNFRLDGALNILSSTEFPLEDKDRVEVLKGASALYYGFSSPAGIVNLTMKRPTPDFLFAEDTFADSNGGIGEHVDVGDTVGKVGYRVNAVYAHLDTGIAYSAGRRYLLGAAFDYKPLDNLVFSNDFEVFGRRIVEPAIFKLPVSSGLAPVRLPSLSTLDPGRNIAGAPWAENDTKEINYLGKVAWNISGDWNLSAYYGLSHLVRIRNNPQFTPSNLTTALESGVGSVSFAAQNTLFENYNYASELSGTLHFGAVSDSVLFGASRKIEDLSSPSPTRSKIAQNFLDPVLIPDPDLVFAPRPPATQIDDKGYYFFNRLNLDEYVQLLAGVRKSDYSDTGTLNAVTSQPYHAAPWSYSGGIVIKPLRWVSVYATYIEGLESTPGAPIADENATENFPPSTSRQYEAGVKLEPTRKLLLQAAAFDIKQGAAYEALNPADGNLHYYTDGQNSYRGVELSLTGYVTRDLALYATTTVLSAHYENTHAAPNINGFWIEGTPDDTWSLAGEYTVSWLTPALKVTAGAYHTGRQAIDATNNAFTPAYTTFDVGGSYDLRMPRYELIFRLNGQNITDKRYWASTGSSVLAEGLPGLVKFSVTARL
jgi:iron complex outermembrane receptor protein